MAQHRKPPAYQEYSSEILANRSFRQMSLAERGLLYTLRLECWTNMTTPSKKDELAKYLGFSLNEIEEAFTTRLDAFIEINGDDLRIPEIDNYRKHLKDRQEKQSEGGKKGARKTNDKLGNKQSNSSASLTGDSTTNPTGNPSTNLTANSQPSRQGTNESLVEFNQAKSRKAQSLNNGDVSVNDHDAWVNDYDKASNGD